MCVDQDAVVVSQAPEDSASPTGRGPSGVIPCTPAGPDPQVAVCEGFFLSPRRLPPPSTDTRTA
jgi:hypothetical protein